MVPYDQDLIWPSGLIRPFQCSMYLLYVPHMFLLIWGIAMHRLEEFEAVGEVHDVEQLRGMVRKAAALAREAMQERDAWRKQHKDVTSDLVRIPEMSLNDLAKMVINRDKHGQGNKSCFGTPPTSEQRGSAAR